MKLTRHFTKEEMSYSAKAQELEIDNTMPDKLISNALRVAVIMEKVREHCGLPVTVLSCYRSEVVNHAVGGSGTSAHLYALACDFRIKGISIKTICEWVRDNIEDFDQIIYEFGEQGWCHIGLSYGTPRKQCLTATKQDGETIYWKGIVSI